MAWRIHDQVVRGEIDNRVKGRINGRIWVLGHEQPLRLELKGNAWPDLAGCVLTFSNPNPTPGDLAGLAQVQRGVCGDMTASRKVKIPTLPLEKISQYDEENRPIPYRWGNVPYLEWYSDVNGRVVIEGEGFEMSISDQAWQPTPEENQAQATRNAAAMDDFLVQAIEAHGASASSTAPVPPPLPISEDIFDPRAVEQIERINNLKHEADKLSGGNMLCGKAANLPLDLEEQYWKNVVAFESAPSKKIREILAGDGLRPPDPLDVPEAELESTLWALIHGLARRGILLEFTDHLSDRELYTLLLDRVLEADTVVLPPGSGWRDHFVIQEFGAPGDEDGALIYLRYYADEETRRDWARDFPEIDMPPHEPLPYDRDSRLPREAE